MQLRNGKMVLITKSINTTVHTNEPTITNIPTIQNPILKHDPFTPNEICINNLIGKLINTCNECKPLHSSYYSSRINLFIEEIRLLREIYYLIYYYGLNTNRNPKFENFQLTLKNKTPEFINDICYQLKKGMYRMLPENDLKNVDELLYEMQQMF
jgi:hypothetical protein